MPDLQPYYNFIIAAAAVVAALLILVFLLKQINTRGRGRKGHRLGIVEYHEVDQTRRLVLVRRDGVEHLILIGGAHDIVVESGITDHVRRDLPAHMVPHGKDDVVPLRAPRAPVFGAKKPPLQAVPPQMDDEPTPA
ncbi:flagellar biosynthetic protein FliO [Aestuariivirga litoralis]|uniref:flagellar biosynthetic protein FliO n=1 Tax=Aestuariivirga litoralis TaxID=2650924 RepID=UPI0018C69114|nr:flagellar biosynthetic protein FliO [Aestuariivirga litoralis]MBG1231186.1 hypothetical protein [Aestuariivirga litoralis]